MTTFGDEPIGNYSCDECVECISVCPTGALVPKDRKQSEVRANNKGA